MTMESQVNEAARRYAKRVWWANEDDLKQEGWVAALEATQSWNPDGRASLKWYVWVAIVRSMRNLLLRDSAPVKAGWHNLHKLKGLTRTELPSDKPRRPDDGIGAQLIPFPEEFVDRGTPENALAEREWVARARVMLAKNIATGRFPERVTAALITGTKVRRLTRTERTRRQLLRACKTAKDTVRADPTAQDLWESR